MPSSRVAKEFEKALIDVESSLRLDADEPGLFPLRILMLFVQFTVFPDEETARYGHDCIRALHYAHERARLDDELWIDPKKRPRRALRLKPEHISPDSVLPFWIVRLLWPVVPLASFLYYTRRSKSWTPEKRRARALEYMFVFLCTKPRRMRPWLEHLAEHALAPLARRFPGLDVAQIAGEVIDSFERRPFPVARYKATGRSTEAAAANVRAYMTGAIKRRANDWLRKNVDPSIDVPASTARRWKKKYGITIASPNHAMELRSRMREHQRHVPDDRISLALAARLFSRARSSVARALRAAEQAHGFAADRGQDGTVLLKKQELKLVQKHLPPPRARTGSTRRLPSRRSS